MPIYIFECDSCGKIEEKQMKMSEDRSQVRCSECSGKTTQLPTYAAVHFKGSGFYVTDYKNNRKPDKKNDK